MEMIAPDWVSGLNSPKGMGVYKDKLYAADLENVVVIDVNAGKIVETIKVEGAEGLNEYRRIKMA